MLKENTIKDLLSDPTFINQAEILSRHLHESLADASQDLIIELIDHRLKSWTDEETEDAIIRELPSLQWRIVYARKDIERRTWHLAQVETDKAEMLGLTIPPDLYSDRETNEAIERANQILHNRQSREWVESVLVFGKEETMARFHQTNRQFQEKLRRVTKFLAQHRKDIDK